MERFVFDTNVMLSALLFEQSVPRRAFDTALDHGRILLSAATLTELTLVLGRPKFDRYVHAEERERFLVALVREASLVEPGEEIHACRDPDDNEFLALAVAGGASYIISGDEDLLILNPFRGIQILAPAEFLASRQAGAS